MVKRIFHHMQENNDNNKNTLLTFKCVYDNCEFVFCPSNLFSNQYYHQKVLCAFIWVKRQRKNCHNQFDFECFTEGNLTQALIFELLHLANQIFRISHIPFGLLLILFVIFLYSPITPFYGSQRV